MKVFDFGSNWKSFSLQQLNDERIEAAIKSIQELLQCESLEGLSFLDIGCGSGIFSIAAAHLGAVRVVGIDINPVCISTSISNYHKFAVGLPVEFRQISILDQEGLSALGKFDVVYAWGSLHHTGSMWHAIRLAAERVSPQGKYILAIYNKHLTSPIWRRIKWFYNLLPEIGQRAMVCVFAPIIYVAKWLVTGQNPQIKERGMDFWFDVIDWIGGYPYEYASALEVEEYVSLIGLRKKSSYMAKVPTGCNEFIFEK